MRRFLPAEQAPLRKRLARSLGLAIVAALFAAPMAIAWGVGNAEVTDYLGPHQTIFSANYSGEIKLNLGPFGNAYLRDNYAPIGVEIKVGGVGKSSGNGAGFFSEQTLAAYSGLFTDPQETVRGVAERLLEDAALEAMKAEMVLLTAFALWTHRRRFLREPVARRTGLGRTTVTYFVVASVCIGSILAPPERSQDVRIEVAVAEGTPLEGVTVDSVLLSDLLDRGIKGLTLLAERQQKAMKAYIEGATDEFIRQQLQVVPAGPDETQMLGFSDLHCNIAMTEIIRRLAAIVEPSMIISSGDDTVNGTAAERGCVTREATIARNIPFVVAGGNHDSDITEAQMKRAGMRVLSGAVIDVNGVKVLGDDDPELNKPFSIERTMQRPETEEQLGKRMLTQATGKDVDVLLIHQPLASVVIATAPNPPAKLIMWGHYHAQDGPHVIVHDDGSWTVAMQDGTAGGVKQPTITSFSTPFSAPRTSADVYLFTRHVPTGLITGVQPIHFMPNGDVVIDPRITTGDVSALPPETRMKLGDTAPPASPSPLAPR
ncbi:hypothetical protein GCM10009841_33900 [Microlunatus panaciterrae]|uniref:Phosphodiesterase n=1 Tax=Microlunatus panaciterrae TaxID=400768 RepID=A0ABS2RJ99_9ACTN|nr:metallophosphoesterase [Microlunatus panaciterrae]MBM7798049.1 putative phosphodiesterase [Microlunatus panaciterrae]